MKDGQNSSGKFLWCPLSLLLKLLRLGAITTSRGSLFQGFTTLKVKESLPSLLTYLFFNNFLGCPLVSALTEPAASSLCNEKKYIGIHSIYAAK